MHRCVISNSNVETRTAKHFQKFSLKIVFISRLRSSSEFSTRRHMEDFSKCLLLHIYWLVPVYLIYTSCFFASRCCPSGEQKGVAIRFCQSIWLILVVSSTCHTLHFYLSYYRYYANTKTCIFYMAIICHSSIQVKHV